MVMDVLLFTRVLFSRFDPSQGFVTLLHNLGARGIVEAIPCGPCLVDGVRGGLVADLSEENNSGTDFLVYAAALLRQFRVVVAIPPILLQVLTSPKPVVLLEQLDELIDVNRALESDLSPHVDYVFFQACKLRVIEYLLKIGSAHFPTGDDSPPRLKWLRARVGDPGLALDVERQKPLDPCFLVGHGENP